MASLAQLNLVESHSSCCNAVAQESQMPVKALDGWQVQLIDSHPNLVTPVSCRFDMQGNLYVVESHTHMPPAEYTGPKADRIYVYTGRKADGTFLTRHLFYEDSVKTMGLAIDQHGWIYVASRSEIIRLKDADGDFKPEQREVLIQHQTKADYPHNGLSGLALSHDGCLYFGQGENFGEPFTLLGSDGSQQTGSGEGGNVYRCRPDGSQVERFATGIWNPFGLCFDQAGRLWCVDNDPDARPPCRLLHLVHTGDYGFQFRFGRAGTNPLLSWNGELPGTLPMAAGTGEAPCEVLQHGNHLLVTSWGDHRIERFKMQPSGGSLEGSLQVLVQGDEQFRPVSMAVADDHSIYFTDWVDRSYPVHGKGRLWRLIPPESDTAAKRLDATQSPLTQLTADQLLARQLYEGTAPSHQYESAVESTDPFMQLAATRGKISSSTSPHQSAWDNQSVQKRSENLRLARWQQLISGFVNSDAYREQVLQGLSDQDSKVRQLAIRYAAELADQSFITSIEQIIQKETLEVDEFSQAIAAISFLKTGSASGSRRDPVRDQMLLDYFFNSGNSNLLRRFALRQLPADAPGLDPIKLLSILNDTQQQALWRDVAYVLANRPSSDSIDDLQTLLENPETPSTFRSDLLACLSNVTSWRLNCTEERLSKLASLDQDPAYQQEFKRIRNQLASASLEATGTSQGRVSAADRSIKPQTKPARQSIDEWLALVGQGGDVHKGWRVWIRSRCIQCHAVDGRGADLGPDLTNLFRSADRKRILQSILEPSREVAPLYATWHILTVDGRVLTGAKLNSGGAGTNLRFLDQNGKTFEIALDEIESQQISFQSIMPEDVVDSLEIGELRDLLEFLSDANR